MCPRCARRVRRQRQRRAARSVCVCSVCGAREGLPCEGYDLSVLIRLILPDPDEIHQPRTNQIGCRRSHNHHVCVYNGNACLYLES